MVDYRRGFIMAAPLASHARIVLHACASLQANGFDAGIELVKTIM